jgi:hypothetical protein
MSLDEKQAFLNAFTSQPQQTTIGFAVLGGVFSEGIDLVSDVMQSEGGKAIWRSLSKERGISIVGWDGERLHNLGSRLDDYTDDDTYDRPGAEFEDEEEVKTRRKMVLVAMKK